MEKVTGIFNNILKKKQSNLVTKLKRFDTVNKGNSLDDDSYLMVDEKNNLAEMDENYIDHIEFTFKGYKENESKKLDSTNKILNQFFEKTLSKYDDIFSLSQSIAKQVSKNKKIEKDIIEKQLNLLVNKSKINTYKYNSLNLKPNICEAIGTILSYAYSKMSDYKIKSMKRLVELRKSIISKKIDILNDFNRYCKSNNKNPNEEKYTKFTKENKNKYDILPELIFIINRYSYVDKILIEFESFPNISEENLQLFQLTIINIYWLFNSLNTVHFNFIDQKLESELYKRFKAKLLEDIDIFKYNKQSLKANNLINKLNLYKNKWNFDDNFTFIENRDTHINIQTCLTHKSIDLSNNADKFTLSKTMSASKRNTFLDFPFSIIKKSEEVNENPNRLEIVKNNINFFKFILISLYSLNNTEELFNLELIVNDSFISEFILAFNKIYNMEWMTSKYSEFHLFDMILYNNVMNRINKFNLEINSLDALTFDKLLNFLYYNHSMTAFNLSFFSAEVSYLIPFIFKVFIGSFKIEILKNNEDCTYLFNDVKDIEEKMLNHLSKHFIHNMQTLFYLIKKKKNLTELGFNFVIPLNIVNKKKYMNTIFKFILNVLFFVSNTRIRKFCLLSPSTLIDCRTDPQINHLISNMNLNNNTALEELSLHMQFYQIVNIKIFLTSKLKILNLGDLDVLTLKLFCKNICNDDFNRKSSLEKLTIGLNNSITDFNLDIKLSFEKLFKLKIKNFFYLCIFTNIEIISKYQYLYLLRILNNNWIPEYRITFNKSSNAIINDAENKKELKKLYYLIPHNMEEKFLEDVDILKLKEKDKNNILIQGINKNPDINDSCYWSLKYVFEHSHTDNLRNDERTKKMIFDILKYIYFIKNPKVIHSHIILKN